ncbi:YidB family protein [Rhizobium sp. Leaf384]|uniref:YidB family protein n=1 Tax=Rhizobium sp. Leaf384 TaxID=1736358 RepID=UPI0009E9FAF3|nr:YidB family protein [Rhizobium sp. Leaf384]
MASNALKALLGILAVAGYQNRDKIGELLKGVRSPTQGGQPGQQPSSDGGLGDLLGTLTGGGGGGLGGLGGLLGGGLGGGLAGGLGDLLRQFEEKGHGETARSWIQHGENKPVDNRQLSEVIDHDTLEDLSSRTGLSAEEILRRLSNTLPTAVDDLTPDGTLPDGDGQPPKSASARSN